jgi:hypothetical protein
MRVRSRLVAWMLGVMLASWAAPASAQFSTVTPFGANPAQAEPEPEMIDADSGVAFIDSAVPRTTIRTRFDLAYRIRQPNRAEYIWAQGGIGNPGPFLPESRVDYQEFRTYGELALNPYFSLFLETPYKWVNPDINPNVNGTGDMNVGLKFAFLNNETWVTTFQFRAYFPTGSARGLGNEHFTLEPGLLVNYRLAEQFHLEGELKYWMPIDGTDFAGDILQYGVGLTWGSRTYGEMWITPVVEMIGYTILGGQSTVAPVPWFVNTVDAEGTILNGALGIRMGFSNSMDWYVGYNRALTGGSWHKDMARIEFRYQF